MQIMLFTSVLMVAVMMSTPSAALDMLILTPASNCTLLGFPGAVPHILDGYEKGPGRCCFTTSREGGYITMCVQDGAKDEWHPCPQGTFNTHHVSSENQVWLERLSSAHVCMNSTTSTSVELVKNNQVFEDADKVIFTLKRDGKQLKSLVKEKDESSPKIDSIDLTPGVYTFVCDAVGGTPDQQFTIKSSGGSLSESPKVTVDLTPDVSFVECSVKGGSHSLSHVLRYNLHVKEVEPKISCNNVAAVPGDRRVVIDCNVTAPHITCKKVVWQSGASDQEFTHGERNTPGRFHTCRMIRPNLISTQLELRDLEEKDFEDTFYVKVKGRHSGDYRQGQKIHRKSFSKTPGLAANIGLVFAAPCVIIIILFYCEN